MTRIGKIGGHLAPVLTAALVLMSFESSVAQEQVREQPGLSWTESEISRAVAPVRAGRRLTPRSWPNGGRVAVCLSFDVDTETWNLARGQTAPVELSAGEFGAVTGLGRVLDLLNRHDIPASFFLPAVTAVVHPNVVPDILKSGRHEIGVHGWIHENLEKLDDAAEEKRLLEKAVAYLTDKIGRRPVGYRAPSWAFSQHTLELLQQMGFLYDTSLMAMDEPYALLVKGESIGMIELPVEWILDDAPYFGRSGALPSPELIFDVYQKEFDRAYDEGTMLMLTMHPRVVGHRSRLESLEKLVAYMQSRPGVWFATAQQIAEYVRQSSKGGSH